MDLTNTQLCEVMEVLGISREDFLCIKTAANPTEAQENIKLLREKAKRGLRKAAKSLHPDVNGGDENKTELFKRAIQVVEDLEKLRIAPSRRFRHVHPMNVVISTIISGYRPGSTYYQSVGTSSTASTTSGFPVGTMYVRFV
jgi:hypothetical protein